MRSLPIPVPSQLDYGIQLTCHHIVFPMRLITIPHIHCGLGLLGAPLLWVSPSESKHAWWFVCARETEREFPWQVKLGLVGPCCLKALNSFQANETKSAGKEITKHIQTERVEL